MTDRAEIERLLNQTGRTLEVIPERHSVEEWDKWVRTPGISLEQLCYQSDVIELLVGALRDALRDALDNPMQKPLTLEDVLKIDDYGEAWWVEYKAGFVTLTILNNDYHQYGEQLLNGFSFKLSDYGEVWRCWATRPTDEEREAAAWES